MRQETQPFLLGADGELITPMDVFRAADFSTGSLVSGNITSGNGLTLKAVSSQVKLRVVNLQMYNREGGWLEIAYYDGGRAGARVLGPYRIQAYSERSIPFAELQGRYFTSSVHVQALSGWTGQPLSNGVDINISYVREATDVYGM